MILHRFTTARCLRVVQQPPITPNRDSACRLIQERRRSRETNTAPCSDAAAGIVWHVHSASIKRLSPHRSSRSTTTKRLLCFALCNSTIPSLRRSQYSLPLEMATATPISLTSIGLSPFRRGTPSKRTCRCPVRIPHQRGTGPRADSASFAVRPQDGALLLPPVHHTVQAGHCGGVLVIKKERFANLCP